MFLMYHNEQETVGEIVSKEYIQLPSTINLSMTTKCFVTNLFFKLPCGFFFLFFNWSPCILVQFEISIVTVTKKS